MVNQPISEAAQEGSLWRTCFHSLCGFSSKFPVKFFDHQVGDGWLSSPRKSAPAVHT